jgi:hypothetical protein
MRQGISTIICSNDFFNQTRFAPPHLEYLPHSHLPLFVSVCSKPGSLQYSLDGELNNQVKAECFHRNKGKTFLLFLASAYSFKYLLEKNGSAKCTCACLKFLPIYFNGMSLMFRCVVAGQIPVITFNACLRQSD